VSRRAICSSAAAAASSPLGFPAHAHCHLADIQSVDSRHTTSLRKHSRPFSKEQVVAAMNCRHAAKVQSEVVNLNLNEPPFQLRMVKGSDYQVDTTHIAVELNSAFNLGPARVRITEFQNTESRL
jgi:hypothetical protein